MTYYTGSAASVYVKGNYFGQVSMISYNVTQSKIPIKGYRCKVGYDIVASGHTSVNGVIIVPLTDFLYMQAAVDSEKRAAIGQVSLKNTRSVIEELVPALSRINRAGGQRRNDIYNQIIGGILSGSSDIVITDSLDSEDELTSASLAALHTEAFDIEIVVGYAEDYYAAISDRKNSTTRKLIGVHLVGESFQVSADDEPVMVAYPFFARNINYGKVTPEIEQISDDALATIDTMDYLKELQEVSFLLSDEGFLQEDTRSFISEAIRSGKYSKDELLIKYPEIANYPYLQAELDYHYPEADAKRGFSRIDDFLTGFGFIPPLNDGSNRGMGELLFASMDSPLTQRFLPTQYSMVKAGTGMATTLNKFGLGGVSDALGLSDNPNRNVSRASRPHAMSTITRGLQTSQERRAASRYLETYFPARRDTNGNLYRRDVYTEVVRYSNGVMGVKVNIREENSNSWSSYIVGYDDFMLGRKNAAPICPDATEDPKFRSIGTSASICEIQRSRLNGLKNKRLNEGSFTDFVARTAYNLTPGPYGKNLLFPSRSRQNRELALSQRMIDLTCPSDDIELYRAVEEPGEDRGGFLEGLGYLLNTNFEGALSYRQWDK